MATHEDDDIVDSVNELWREMTADRSHHQVLGLRFHLAFTHVAKISRAEVACHDDDCVSEVYHSALAIRQPAIVQDLQEKSDEFPASLLDLVYQYNTVWLATNVFRQLTCEIDGSESRNRESGLSLEEEPTSRIMTHISRGSTNKARNGVFLRVFRRIYPDHRVG